MPRSNPAARLRLICLPHAGAGASTYFAWGAALHPAGIEVRSVQYPGREGRFAETPLRDARTMVDALADAWREMTGGGRCALYGHSMGALLGFELAAELARRGVANPPVQLFLGGHQAPHLPYRAPSVATLPDAEFLPAVSEHFGGIPEALLQDADFAAMIRGTLRADFSLVENYRWSGAGPLDLPLGISGGTEDRWTSERELEGWRSHTRGRCTVRLHPGGHFFNVSDRDAVLAAIIAALEGV